MSSQLLLEAAKQKIVRSLKGHPTKIFGQGIERVEDPIKFYLKKNNVIVNTQLRGIFSHLFHQLKLCRFIEKIAKAVENFENSNRSIMF